MLAKRQWELPFLAFPHSLLQRRSSPAHGPSQRAQLPSPSCSRRARRYLRCPESPAALRPGKVAGEQGAAKQGQQASKPEGNRWEPEDSAETSSPWQQEQRGFCQGSKMGLGGRKPPKSVLKPNKKSKPDLWHKTQAGGFAWKPLKLSPYPTHELCLL